MRTRSRFGIVIVAWIAVAGCTDDTRDPRPAAQPKATASIRIVVNEEAERAAGRVGVDLEAAVADALRVVGRQLDLPVTTISIIVRPGGAIPEIGIGGFTDPLGDVHLYLDPGHADFGHALHVWLGPLVAHEAHHAARTVDGPGYGESLVEAIASEGLADVFSEEAFAAAPTLPWTRALEPGEMCPWWRRALRESDPYDHEVWFFGAGRPPRWTGYALGYELVRRYLKAHPTTAADSVRTPADAIVGAADFCRS